MSNMFGITLMKNGDYVTGRLSFDDGKIFYRCKVVGLDANKSRDAIIVIHEGGREVMLKSSIIKIESINE